MSYPLPNNVRCPSCGYDMSGLPSWVCPECGENHADCAEALAARAVFLESWPKSMARVRVYAIAVPIVFCIAAGIGL